MKRLAIVTAIGSAAFAAVPAHAADPDEMSKDIIAVQIRKQGFPCEAPQSAERAPETQPDDAIWILTCKGVRYRVELVPKMAAKVERLASDDKASSSKP